VAPRRARRGRGRKSDPAGDGAFPDAEKADYPGIPWDNLARTRDFYTHHYSRIDPTRLRETLDVSLRNLLAELDRLDIPEFLEEEPGPL
jgi:hypothetical protein